MAADPDPFESMAKLVELERWHDALPLIEKQLKDNPKDPRGHILLGQIYFWLSQFDKCKEHFELCVSTDAGYFESTAASFLARRSASSSRSRSSSVRTPRASAA